MQQAGASYDCGESGIGAENIERIYAGGELIPETTFKKSLTVQPEGGKEINRKMEQPVVWIPKSFISIDEKVFEGCEEVVLDFE